MSFVKTYQFEEQNSHVCELFTYSLRLSAGLMEGWHLPSIYDFFCTLLSVPWEYGFVITDENNEMHNSSPYIFKLKFLYRILYFCKERGTFSWCLNLASTFWILIYAVNVWQEWLTFSNFVFSLYPLACGRKSLCSILLSCPLLLPF